MIRNILKYAVLTAAIFVANEFVWLTDAEATFDFTGTSYSQDFDSLTTGSWTNDTAPTKGWELYRNPAYTAVTAYTLGTGTSNAGAFYSFGTAAADRALGGVGSGGFNGWIAFGIKNDTSSSYSSVNVSYDGEQWRNGGAVSPALSLAQTMVMEYAFGKGFAAITPTSWKITGFDFKSPTFGTSAAAALDGNALANRVAGIGGSLAFDSGVSWDNGEILWLRWIEANDPGNDHALAIDNFSFSASAAVVPELPTLYTFGSLIGAFGVYGLAMTYFKRRRAV